jgi:hypothetical protein
VVNTFEGQHGRGGHDVPVTEALMAARQLADGTIVATRGWVSVANQKAIEAAGLSFILGARIFFEVPYVVAGPPDPPTITVTRSSTTNRRPTERGARCAGSTSRSPRPSAVARKVPAKRNRLVTLIGADKSALEAKARASRAPQKVEVTDRCGGE